VEQIVDQPYQVPVPVQRQVHTVRQVFHQQVQGQRIQPVVAGQQAVSLGAHSHVVGRTGSTVVQNNVFGAGAVVAPGAASALALDAADGVIDGRYFGAQVVNGGVGTVGVGHVGFGGFGGFAAQSAVVARGGAGAALALDAADGVIDGKYFGHQVVQGRPGFGAPAFGAPAFGAAPFGAAQFGGSNAARLDAADGVIDGKYFGRPIVQA
jgi:hypothetical protein